jgi:hypothetical protein
MGLRQAAPRCENYVCNIIKLLDVKEWLGCLTTVSLSPAGWLFVAAGLAANPTMPFEFSSQKQRNFTDIVGRCGDRPTVSRTTEKDVSELL